MVIQQLALHWTLLKSRIYQGTKQGGNFQARHLLSMQAVRPVTSPVRYSNIWTTSRLAQRSGFLSRQTLNRSILPSVHSTISVRTISWTPLQRGNIKVQHVKFLAPKNRFIFQSKWIQRFILWIICLRAIGILFGNKSEDGRGTQEMTIDAQDEKNSAAEVPGSQAVESDEMEFTIDEENAWFLPFTWPRKKPPVPYRSSDEEWQEFRNLSQDAERQLGVKTQAVDYVRYVAEHHPQVRRILGTASAKSRYWIDIDYPMRYDEGYEMVGVVITDDFVAIGVRDYDASTIDQFHRVISTIPMVTAIWEVSKAMFTQRDTLTTGVKKNDRLPIGVPGVPDLGASPELAKVLRTSIRSLQIRPRSNKSVPKGCVMVSGRVDVEGTKAWAQFQIVGYYNPMKDAWAALPLIGIGPVRPVTLKPAD